jgi:hypothetical protein
MKVVHAAAKTSDYALSHIASTVRANKYWVNKWATKFFAKRKDTN